MSIQFNTAVSLAQQYNLQPPPNPMTDPAGYANWIQDTVAPLSPLPVPTSGSQTLEPSYHPQLAGLTGNQGAPFAEQVRGQQPQPDTDMDLALLSQDVYNAEGADSVGSAGWTRVDADQLLEAGIDAPPGTTFDADSNQFVSSSGLQASIYTNPDGQYVLAFAGTDPTSLADWMSNGAQGLGFSDAQYNQAMTIAQDAAAAFGDELAITGHSLGGGLASAAALATDSPAVTFNAAGLSDESLRNLGFTPNGARAHAADGLVRRYNVENDILTGAQQGVSPLPDAVGHELRLDNTYLIQDPFRAHMMDAVLRGLETGNVTAVETSPLESAIARPGEVALDLTGRTLREGIELTGNVVDSGVELLGDTVDAGRHLINGRPGEAVVGLTGDVAEAGLQVTGNVADSLLDTTGHVIDSGGSLVGGWIRDLGSATGLEGVGNTVGGWVEGGAQWLGNGLDTAGDWVSTGFDQAGSFISDLSSRAGQGIDSGLRWTGNAAVATGEAIVDGAQIVGGAIVDGAREVGRFLNPFSR